MYQHHLKITNPLEEANHHRISLFACLLDLHTFNPDLDDSSPLPSKTCNWPNLQTTLPLHI